MRGMVYSFTVHYVHRGIFTLNPYIPLSTKSANSYYETGSHEPAERKQKGYYIMGIDGNVAPSCTVIMLVLAG